MSISINTGTGPNYGSYGFSMDRNVLLQGNAVMNPSVPDSTGTYNANGNSPGTRALKRAGTVECQTCKNRKYQDGSNDPGVSFKTPGHISPESSASAVMSHEQEHVRNETSRASAEGRKVVYQSVTLETSVCPECGRVYVSGGKTRTVTKAADKKDYFMENMQKSMDKFFGRSLDLRV